MKKAFPLIIILGLLTSNACKKQEVEDRPKSHVIANAGDPESIVLSFNPGSCSPLNNTIQLDGSRSTAMTGNIISYYWTYLQNHPRNTGGSAIIANQDESATTVLVSIPGEYWFSLRVFDDNNGFDLDSVKIEVTTDSEHEVKTKEIKQAFVGELKAMVPVSVVAFDHKVIVQNYKKSEAGSNGNISDDFFKIYDLNSKSWSDLPVATMRKGINMVSVGNKLVLSGGNLKNGGYYDKVDILDINTENWTFLEFPGNFKISNVAVEGTKIFFTGSEINQAYSDFSDKVEILDLATNTWTHTRMSQQRKSCMIIPAGDLVYFVSNPEGASLNIVDVYHVTTNSWTAANIESDFLGNRGLAFNNKIYFFGNYGSGVENGKVITWNPGTGDKEELCMGPGNVNIYPYDGQLLITRNVLFNWEFKETEFFKYDPVTGVWTQGLATHTYNGIIGVGTIIGQSGHSRIFTLGPLLYPDNPYEYAFDPVLPDFSCWEIEF